MGMAKSKVFFMTDQPEGGGLEWYTAGIVAKAMKLFDDAKLYKCFNKGDSVAVKISYSGWLGVNYLRPTYIRAIVDKIKEHGGRPFLVDTTRMLEMGGSATDAKMYLEMANAAGYNALSMGCPVIIGDGTGYDDVRIEIPDGILLKQAYLARAIAEADAMIVITRFKGHVKASYAGVFKNVGIGCSSQRGKTYVHLILHPKIGIKKWKFNAYRCKGKKCSLWKLCDNECPVGARRVLDDHMEWDKERCVECGSPAASIESFKCGVMVFPPEVLNWFKIALGDATSAFVRFLDKDRVGFITYATDISPGCDCGQSAERPFISDLGVFASADPVAIDTACLDMATAQPGLPGSAAEKIGAMKPGSDKFPTIYPVGIGKSQSLFGLKWVTVNTARILGIGSMDYELVKPQPPPSDEFYKFFYPEIASLEKTAGWHRRKAFKIQDLHPPNYSYEPEPRVPIKELSRR